MLPMAVNGDRHVVFIGVDTHSSRALATVPSWSRQLGTPLAVTPIDVPLGATRAVFETILDRLEADSAAVGAVITNHKVAMYEAAADRCSLVSADANELRECNVLASRPGGLAAFATDVQSIGAALDRIWPACSAPVVCLGGGGSAAALCLHLLRRAAPPREVIICERDAGRALELTELFGKQAARAGVGLTIESGQAQWDDVVSTLAPGGLVVNATGLGKSDGLSPLTANAMLPRHATVWDLNYRGELPYLRLARSREHDLRLRVHDGLHLFVLGWLAALCTVLDVQPQEQAESKFAAIAAEVVQ